MQPFVEHSGKIAVLDQDNLDTDRIIPARYVVTILKGIFLKGVGLSVLGGELAFLALYSVIVFVLATRKLNQKLT